MIIFRTAVHNFVLQPEQLQVTLNRYQRFTSCSHNSNSRL
jgi:hypothetical protein